MGIQGCRAYIFGTDGRIRQSIEFLAEDDDKAKEHARQPVDGHDIELWHSAKKIAEIKSKP
jgi:hypothetical protein